MRAGITKRGGRAKDPSPPLAQVYGPVVDWVLQELGVRLHITDSIFGAELSAEAVQGVREFLQGEASPLRRAAGGAPTCVRGHAKPHAPLAPGHLFGNSGSLC